jgi:acetylornithine deacetylase/succinyl-diaminopimelate desuccinylase-like protein
MRDNYLEEYFTFLRFPSVSTDEKYAGNVRECADWLSQKLTGIGLDSKVVPTKGHPIVWARN